jgi:hypothetical protein
MLLEKNRKLQGKAKIYRRYGEPVIDIELFDKETKESCRSLILNKFKISSIDIPHKRVRYRFVYFNPNDEYSKIFGETRYHHIDFLIIQIPTEWFEAERIYRNISFQVVLEEWIKRFEKDLFKYYKISKNTSGEEFRKLLWETKEILIDSFMNFFKRPIKGKLRKDGMKVLLYLHFFINVGDLFNAFIRITRKEEKTLKWFFDLEKVKPLYRIDSQLAYELCEIAKEFVEVSYEKW